MLCSEPLHALDGWGDAQPRKRATLIERQLQSSQLPAPAHYPLTKTFDAIVIGVGGMGSATVYELAKRGKRVLGLERFEVPHELGSSHGVNRIIRLAYYEHESYVPLLRRAYQLWDELELVVGERLLHKTGSIDTDTEGGEIFQGSLDSCRLHQIPHEVLGAAEANARFPGYRLPAGHMALLQADGGFLLSERCIVGYVEAARELGAEVHARAAVLEWRVSSSGVVEVRTQRERYEAGALVITAGAWASQLVPALEQLALPERQVLAWFETGQPELFAAQRFPVFNAMFEEGRYYGFPVFGIPGFKIGRYHHLGESMPVDEMLRELTSRDEQVLRSAVARYFPGANGKLLGMKTCMFTNSPDEHFILDKLPGQPEVSLAAGFSGHGFKFCSVVGEIMADLALHGETRHEIERLRLGRFA